jgi:Undecaprenyl-phosphate glucose phosphotransferase
MLKERSRKYKINFVIMDFIFILLSWGIAYIIRREIDFPSRFLIDDERNKWYLYTAIFGSVTHILIFLGGKLYNSKRDQSFTVELKSIVLGSISNLLFLLAIIFFFRPISYSRGFIVYQTIVVIVIVILTHFILKRFLRYLRSKGINLRYVLIVGCSQASNVFYKRLEAQKEFGYVIVGFIGKKSSFMKNLRENVPENLYLGNSRNFRKITKEFVKNGQLDLIVTAISVEDNVQLNNIYRFCEFESIDLKIIPDYLNFISMHSSVEEIEGLPVLSIGLVPLMQGYNWLLKRLFDLVFSILIILLGSPLFLIVSLAILLTSRGPIIISQKRMGLDRKPFYMYKFRTMVTSSQRDADTKWTVKDDPRRTKLGKYLRKYSIDELPQFFNVIFGQMSVVGPRPERPHFVHQFKKDVEKYMLRHRMKAGVTGWAQVNGLRGDTSIKERVKYDIFYIENWSLWFDIRICFLTLKIIVKDASAI